MQRKSIKNSILRKILPVALSIAMVCQSVPMTSMAAEAAQETRAVESEAVQANEPAAEASSEEALKSEAVSTEASKSEENSLAETSSEETKSEEVSSSEASSEETKSEEASSTEALSEAESATEASSEEISTETATEDTTEVETETETETATDTSTDSMSAFEETKGGSFSNVSVTFSGFVAYVNAEYTKAVEGSDVSYYLVQYDAEGKKIGRSYTGIDESSFGTALASDTRSVKLIAEESYYKTTDGNKERVKDSYEHPQSYERDNIPDVEFKVDKLTEGTESISVDFSYTRNMHNDTGRSGSFEYKLKYGENKDGKDWKALKANSYLDVHYNYEKGNYQVVFSGLESGKTYYGSLYIYIIASGSQYEDGRYENVKAFEQTIDLGSFKPAENKKYDLAETFPDDTFRSMIISELNLTESATTVDTLQLEKIKSLNNERKTPSDPVVKSLKGIELLTNLEKLYMGYNEISDVSDIDWSKFEQLSALDLSGNNLTKMPDLSKNSARIYFNISNNMLPESEIENIQSKLPSSFEPDENYYYRIRMQRTGEFDVVIEDTYYSYDGWTLVLVKPVNYKFYLYNVRYYIDGTEKDFGSSGNISSYDDWYIRENELKDLEEGTHTLKVELYGDDNEIYGVKEKKFQVVADKPGMPLKDKYYISGTDSERVQVLGNRDKKVTAMYVMDGDKIIGMNLGSVDNTTTSYYETRYSKLSPEPIKMSGLCGYSEMEIIVPGVREGTYDLKVEFEDGTSNIFKNAIEYVAALLTDVDIGYDCDNTGDYFYLSMKGKGVDPAKLDYAFSYEGETLPAEYIEYKNTYSGCIAKFKRSDGGTFSSGELINVMVTPKSESGITVVENTYSAYVHSGIYYCAYNPFTNRVEVAVASELDSEDIDIRLYKSGWKEQLEIKSEYKDILHYLTPIKDGKEYPLSYGSYTVYAYTKDGQQYSNSLSIELSAYSTDVWTGRGLIPEGTKEQNFLYNSSLPYSEGAEFTSQITGGNLVKPLEATEISTYEYNNNFMQIEMKYDLSSLKAGSYTVSVYEKGIAKPLSSFTLKVQKADKFIITNDYISASWRADGKLNIGFSTLNTSKTDEFMVTLTDINGKEVEGLRATVSNRSTNYVQLAVEGIQKEKAYTYYYITIKHKTLGDAYYYMDNETKFFSGKGKFTKLYDNRIVDNSSDGKMYAVYIGGDKIFPATLEIYLPYGTQKVYSQTINEKDVKAFTNSSYRYEFSQSLVDSLPDKDGIYDVCVILADGYSSAWSRYGIGVYTDAPSGWSVSPSALSLSMQNEETKTAILTVSGSKANPTFKSSNTAVVTVKADSKDKNKATVTALSAGEAVITITADNITKEVKVTVAARVVKPESVALRASSKTVNKGDKVTFTTDVTPSDAWKEDSSITYTSSDPEILEIPADAKSRSFTAVAKKPGKVTVTATLDNTELTASCELDIKDVLTDDDKDGLVEAMLKEVGEPWSFSAKSDGQSVNGVLSDIKLPEGWKWEKPDTKPAADNSMPVQKFAAVCTKEGYDSFTAYIPVKVTSIDRVLIKGEDRAAAGTKQEYTYAYEYTGADPAGLAVTQQWTLKDGISLYEEAAKTDEKSITVKAGGNGSISVSVTFTDSRTNKGVTLTGNKTVAANANAITIVVDKESQPGKAVKNYTYNDDDSCISIDLKDFDSKDNKLLALSAKGAEKIKWLSSDTGVLSVDSKGVVTLKKAGVAEVTAQDVNDKTGNTKASVTIKLVDYSPALSSAAITVIQASEKGTYLGIEAQNGNKITAVTVTGATSGKLETKSDDAGSWWIKASGYTKKTTENNVTLKVTTEDGNKEYSFPVKVTVDVSEPDAKSVKLKQTVKPNVFYCGEKAQNAEFTVTSQKYSITEIKAVSGAYEVGSYDAESGKLVLKPKDSSKDVMAKLAKNCSVTLEVEAYGYGKYKIPVNVNLANTKPKLKIADAFFTASGTTAYVSLYDNKTEMSAEGISFTVTKNPNKDSRVIVSGTSDRIGLKLEITGKGKGGAYTATARCNTWTSDLTVKGKATLTDTKKLALETDITKATINTTKEYNKPITVNAWVKGSRDMSVVLNATPKGAVTVNKVSDNSFEIAANPGASGNATVEITGKVGSADIKKATVTVTLNKNTPSIKLSAKGSINLADRSRTAITYTPSFVNLPNTTKAVAVKVTENSDKFSASLDSSGRIEVRALPGAAIAYSKAGYPVGLDITMDNGRTLTPIVTIKPSSKQPKVTASPVNTALYKTNTATAAKYRLSAGTGYKVSSAVIIADKNSAKFTASYDSATETITIRLADGAGRVKAGKYGLKFNVLTEGSTAPAKVTVNVTVK